MTKNRWNSQRFIERVPEAELERKMALLRRDMKRFERDQRIQKTRLWDYLFRSEFETRDSLVKRYPMDEVINGRIPVVDLNKNEQLSSVPLAEVIRQFETFKIRRSAELKLHEGGQHWQQPRPDYNNLQPVVSLPIRRSVNNASYSKLMDGSYLQPDEQQQQQQLEWMLIGREDSVRVDSPSDAEFHCIAADVTSHSLLPSVDRAIIPVSALDRKTSTVSSGVGGGGERKGVKKPVDDVSQRCHTTGAALPGHGGDGNAFNSYRSDKCNTATLPDVKTAIACRNGIDSDNSTSSDWSTSSDRNKMRRKREMTQDARQNGLLALPAIAEVSTDTQSQQATLLSDERTAVRVKRLSTSGHDQDSAEQKNQTSERSRIKLPQIE